MRCFVLLSCLAVSVVTGSVLADSATTNRLPEVVVTAERLCETTATTPSAVTIVTREQIDQQQARTVREVLSQQAGVEVASTGQPGGQSSLFLRGANYNQTLVLIDGMRVNNPFNSAFDFANLPVDNIERIEILRGPQSTLYGSEAMGGVINIVTRQGAAQPTGAIMVEGGSFDSFRTRESFSMTAGQLSLAASGSYFTTENERPNSAEDVWNASARASYQFLEHLSASLLTTYSQTHAGAPGDRNLTGASGFDRNDFLNNEGTLVALTVIAQPVESWDITLKLAHDYQRILFNEPQPNPTPFPAPWDNLPAYMEATQTTRQQLDLQNVIALGEQHQFVLGGSVDDSQATDRSTLLGANPARQSILDKALYGQYAFTPVPRFTVNAGGRVDDYTTFGAAGTFKTGARWTAPVTETLVRGNVGSGFRAPSVRDLIQTYGGNPDLQPERSLGWDFGVDQPLCNNQLHVGVDYFQNEFHGLTVSTNAPPPFYSKLVNTGRARTLGMENFVTWMPVTNLTLRGTYTWLAEARDLSSHAPLTRRPEHSGSLNASYRFLRRFDSSATATLLGSRFDNNFGTGKRVVNAGFAKLDLALGCDVCQHFQVFARVENLLGDRYEEVVGYPALGRTFWGGGTVKF